MNKLARIFRLLGGRSRLNIVALLVSVNGGVAVQNIANAMQMTHSAVSHQLSLLAAANIVKAKKQGREVFYSMANTAEGTKVRLMLKV